MQPQQPPRNLEKEYFKNKDNIQFTFQDFNLKDVEDLPLKIDAKEEIINFFSGNVLKPIDNPLVKRVLLLIFGIQQPNQSPFFNNNNDENVFLTDDNSNQNDPENQYLAQFYNLKTRMEKQLIYSFYFVLCIKFPQVIPGNMAQKTQTINYFKHKMQKYYAKTFTEIPSPKDDVVNYSIFILGYIIHYLFYKYFIKHREIFDLRFDYDCYHILIFEFNGVYVSDHYVRLQIEQIFTNKFLEYERIRQLYIQKQAKLAMQKPNSFFGLKLETVNQENLDQDGKQFQKTIIDKFIKSSNKSNNLKKIQSEEDEKPQKNKYFQKSNNSTLYNNNFKNSTNESQDQNTSQQQQQQQQQQEKHNYNSKWDLNNFQLNCYQISPAMNKILSYEDMSLPLVKKKMVQHSMEKIHQRQNNMLSQLKQLNRKKKVKKVEENYDFHKQTVLQQYGIHRTIDPQKHPPVAQKYLKPIEEQNLIFTTHQQGYSQLPSSLEIFNKNQSLENPVQKVKVRELEKHENMSMQKNIYEAKRIVLGTMEEDYQKKLKQAKYHVIPKNQMYNPQDHYQSLKDVIAIKKKDIEKQKQDMENYLEDNPELLEIEIKSKFPSQKLNQSSGKSPLKHHPLNQLGVSGNFSQTQSVFMQKSGENSHQQSQQPQQQQQQQQTTVQQDNMKAFQTISNLKQTLIQQKKQPPKQKINPHRVIVTEIYDKDGLSISKKEQMQKQQEYEKLKQKQQSEEKKLVYKDHRKTYKQEHQKILDPSNYQTLDQKHQKQKKMLNPSQFIQEKVENALKKNSFQGQNMDSSYQNQIKIQTNYEQNPRSSIQDIKNNNEINNNMSVQQKRVQSTQQHQEMVKNQQKRQELYNQGQAYRKQISQIEQEYTNQYQNQKNIVSGINDEPNIQISQNTLEIIKENYTQRSTQFL